MAYILAVFIGPYMTLNIIALFAISGVVAKETREYFKKKRESVE